MLCTASPAVPTFGAPILTNSGFDLIAVEFNLSLGDRVKVPEVTVLRMNKGRNGREGGWGEVFKRA